VAQAGAHSGHTAGNTATEAVNVEGEREHLLNFVTHGVGCLIATEVEDSCIAMKSNFRLILRQLGKGVAEM